MNKLIEIFGDEKSLMLFSIMVVYISSFLFVMTMRNSRRSLRKTNRDKAFDLLLKANEQNTLDGNSVNLIYKRLIARKYGYITYVDFLESFIVHVRQKDEDGALTGQIENLIYPILEKEKAEKPYSCVEEKERRILLAIENSASQNEYHSIKTNLTDLSIVIESNQKALNRARMTNKWTIPISIIGVLLTLFIWLYGSSMSEKDVERISRQIYSNISDSIKTVDTDSLSIK